MKNKKTINMTSIIIVSCLIVGILLGIFCTSLTSLQQYNIVAKIVGDSYKTNPETTNNILNSVKSNNNNNFSIGDEILSKYGYNKHTLMGKNALYLIIITCIMMLIISGVILLIRYKTNKQRLNRINNLTRYLEEINLGRECILLRQEDEFSHLEDELYKTVGELRCTKELALQERYTLSDNLADIAHQLKTPITSMSLMTQLLTESCTEDDIDCLNKLTSQLSRLERLVSSLLTISKLDSCTLTLECKLIDIHTLLSYAVEPIEDTLSERCQVFSIENTEHLELLTDINWTSEALLNLIKNCSEHTPEGGQITAHYSQNPLYTEIIIEDSGSGFTQEDLPYIFKRFYRGNNSSKDSIGIGLSLSKSIIERQNGTIHAENQSNNGARFVIKFYT